MPKTVYERNFERLGKLIDLSLVKNGKASVFRDPGRSGLMRFTVEVLARPAAHQVVLSLAHYYEQNGDLVPDPDMEILVDFQDGTAGTVQALSITHNTGLYARVYSEGFGRGTINPREKKEQNAFLSIWLRNLLAQGYAPGVERSAREKTVAVPTLS